MTSRFPFFQAPSPLHGHGLFAAEDLPAGSVINTWEAPDGVLVMCGFNWSDNPNAQLLKRCRVRILRDVQAGEELTLERYR